MGFLKRITALFSSPGDSGKDALWIAVKCSRCGEIIRSRVHLYNDLSVDYEDGITMYRCHKQLIGEGIGGQHCFQRVDVELTFDANRKLIGREASGGVFVDAA